MNVQWKELLLGICIYFIIIWLFMKGKTWYHEHQEQVHEGYSKDEKQ